MEWTVAIGVDTHKEAHVAVALDALGTQRGSREIPTTPAGYGQLLSWAQSSAYPPLPLKARAVTARGSSASSSEPASLCMSANARAARSGGEGRAI
jgi:hypothetical protein